MFLQPELFFSASNNLCYENTLTGAKSKDLGKQMQC